MIKYKLSYVLFSFLPDPDPGDRMQPVSDDKCRNQCDPIATCFCMLVYGYYTCMCPEGHEGSGLVGQCSSK